jgi:hypothetical protein
VLVQAVSRRLHGAAGEFDLPLPLSSPYGIECRLGTAQKIVFTFDSELASATVTVKACQASIASVTICGQDLEVQLADVANCQWITLLMSEVTNSAGGVLEAVELCFGLLETDVNGSRGVSGSDVLIINREVGLEVTAANFRADVNCTGGVTGADVLLVNRRVGTLLPPP